MTGMHEQCGSLPALWVGQDVRENFTRDAMEQRDWHDRTDVVRCRPARSASCSCEIPRKP